MDDIHEANEPSSQEAVGKPHLLEAMTPRGRLAPSLFYHS